MNAQSNLVFFQRGVFDRNRLINRFSHTKFLFDLIHLEEIFKIINGFAHERNGFFVFQHELMEK